jgi:prevent-host-death family protein
MSTVKLTATQFQERPGEALDRALTQHLIIVKHGRPRNVVLSYEEYERLMKRDRQVFTVDQLDEADIAEIANAAMEPGHEHLNRELPKRRR